MGESARCALKELPALLERLIPLRERLMGGILERIPDAQINGDRQRRLPGHLSVSFPGADAESLVLALDLEGIEVGVGSACTARTMKTSHVLKAMGVEDSLGLGTITLSLHAETTQEEIDRVLEVLHNKFKWEVVSSR